MLGALCFMYICVFRFMARRSLSAMGAMGGRQGGRGKGLFGGVMSSTAKMVNPSEIGKFTQKCMLCAPMHCSISSPNGYILYGSALLMSRLY